jgi:NADH-quinone oxidoreductase subunit N
MTPLPSHAIAASAAAAALLAGLAMLRLERHGRAGLGPAAVLIALAAGIGLAPGAHPGWTPLVVGVVIAALTRDGDELLHGECALKLLWVMGSAIALSWAGLELLALATGTPYVLEQWAVLRLGLEPTFLWSTALPLSLLIGVVLLGGAPFHFWLGDMFQGVRPWLAPLAAATLQITGAVWLVARLDSVGMFPPGAQLAWGLLRIAAWVAFMAGAVTLGAQRRPERRVGTLASLNGALVLALIAAGRGPETAWLVNWAAHLALALTGASVLARFLPVSTPAGPGAPILRRHPAFAILGLLCLFSLAGVPGTPGGRLWLEVARALGTTGRHDLLVPLAIAWLTALWKAVEQLREAYGVPAGPSTAVRPVPAPARVALAISGAGLAGLAGLAGAGLLPW